MYGHAVRCEQSAIVCSNFIDFPEKADRSSDHLLKNSIAPAPIRTSEKPPTCAKVAIFVTYHHCVKDTFANRPLQPQALEEFGLCSI